MEKIQWQKVKSLATAWDAKCNKGGKNWKNSTESWPDNETEKIFSPQNAFTKCSSLKFKRKRFNVKRFRSISVREFHWTGHCIVPTNSSFIVYDFRLLLFFATAALTYGAMIDLHYFHFELYAYVHRAHSLVCVQKTTYKQHAWYGNIETNKEICFCCACVHFNVFTITALIVIFESQ